jgi:hypothetical protein
MRIPDPEIAAVLTVKWAGRLLRTLLIALIVAVVAHLLIRGLPVGAAFMLVLVGSGINALVDSIRRRVTRMNLRRRE